MLWLWILAIVVLLFAIVASSRMYIRIRFRRIGEDDHILVRASGLFGLIRYKYEIPVVKFKGLYGKNLTANEHQEAANVHESQINITLQNMRTIVERGKRLLENSNGLHLWVLQTLRHVHCTQIKWQTDVGTKDAAQTAISAGGLWATKSMLLGLVSHLIYLESKPEIAINPTYNQPQFKTEATVHLHINVWRMMHAGMRLTKRVLKIPGGMRVWRRTLFGAG